MASIPGPMIHGPGQDHRDLAAPEAGLDVVLDLGQRVGTEAAGVAHLLQRRGRLHERLRVPASVAEHDVVEPCRAGEAAPEQRLPPGDRVLVGAAEPNRVGDAGLRQRVAGGHQFFPGSRDLQVVLGEDRLVVEQLGRLDAIADGHSLPSDEV